MATTLTSDVPDHRDGGIAWRVGASRGLVVTHNRV